jgi:ferredoxin-thioredoxin reductase catalytic chain
VKDFGYCYCALYVRKDVVEGKNPVAPIPERRPLEKQARAHRGAAEPSVKASPAAEEPATTKMKMWYCKQCGYVCFRENPPYICPICKAKRELFAEMTISTSVQG